MRGFELLPLYPVTDESYSLGDAVMRGRGGDLVLGGDGAEARALEPAGKDASKGLIQVAADALVEAGSVEPGDEVRLNRVWRQGLL